MQLSTALSHRQKLCFVTIPTAPSLTVLRLKIRELNNKGILHLSNTLKASSCNISRLEIGGRFGDDGMISIAEALRTNLSIRKIDIGMAEGFTDLGGRAILRAVQGQDESLTSKIESNHTLQNVYITERAGMFMSQDLRTKLQSITNVDPHPTLQNKAWGYIEKKIQDLSSINLDTKLGPHLLSFVSSRGGVDSVYSLLRSNSELFTSYPSPEKARIASEMERMAHENEILKALLMSERKYRSQRQFSHSTIQSTTVGSDNTIRVQDLDEDDHHQRKAMTRCLLLPLFKAFEMCKFILDLLKDKEE